MQEEIKKLERDHWIVWGQLAVLGLPFIGIVITLAYQRTSALELQERTANTDFELKVAEIVMSSPTPWHAEKRLALLERMYPNRITREFRSKFRSDEFPGLRHYEMRMEILKLLASKQQQPDEILEGVRTLFPDDRSWFDKMYPPSNDIRMS